MAGGGGRLGPGGTGGGRGGARAAGLGGLGEPAEEFLSAACRQRARASVRQRFRIASVTAVIATVVIASVIVLQVRAADSRNLTLAQSRAETSQLIESANQSANDPVLSLLLDVEAYRVGGATADNGLLSAQEDFFTSTLSNPAGAGSAVAFDTAAPLLAVAGQDAMTVFLVTTQQRAVTLRGGSPFYAAAFNPSGTLLAGAEQDGTTIVWDVKTWKPVATLGTANGLSVNTVAFQPDRSGGHQRCRHAGGSARSSDLDVPGGDRGERGHDQCDSVQPGRHPACRRVLRPNGAPVECPREPKAGQADRAQRASQGGCVQSRFRPARLGRR